MIISNKAQNNNPYNNINQPATNLANPATMAPRPAALRATVLTKEPSAAPAVHATADTKMTDQTDCVEVRSMVD